MFRGFFPGCFAVLLLAAVVLQTAVADGLESVRVEGDTLVLRGQRSDAPVHLMELPPWQPVFTVDCTGVVARVTQGPDVRLTLPRFEGGRDRLYSSFLLVSEAGGGTYQAVGTNRYVEGTAAIARHRDPFPAARSIKGLQVEITEDALALGIQHGALNVNLSSLVDLKGRTNSLPWPVDGQPVLFRRSAVESLDRQIKRLSDAGVTVYLILLTYASGDPALDRVMLHPAYDPKAPNKLGAFNTATPEGVRHFRACLEFLADRYHRPGSPHGRAAGYILGNEVNSHWFWSNRGRVNLSTFTGDYLQAARLAHTALRTASSSARLYLSLEHHWNIRYPGGDALQTFPGRPFLDEFARRARTQGDFDWHVAYHPYPENLFEPRSWRDKTATTNVLTTPRITFKNIELLPAYLRRPELLYEGQPRRVILSEQGFHTPDGPEGETRQAAGYAYAWRKITAAGGIDAFILHRHVDHPREGGLHLGLWRRANGTGAASEKKQIYEVFRLADTPDWQKAFAFALPLIGIPSWDALP